MPVRKLSATVILIAAVAACGRTDLEGGPYHEYDVRSAPVDVVPDVPDVPEEDAEPDVEEDEATPDVEPEVVDVVPEADAPDFTGLSCMSAAMCAICCAGSDLSCQLGCLDEADPSARSDVMAVFTCAMSTGCGSDFACIMDQCADEFAECDGGPGGTGGCLSLAWCLVSSGCQSATACTEQGLCYQDCFGAARPEVMGVARDLLACVVGDCMTACATGLTTTECIMCLATNCLMSLRGCIGF